MNGQLIDELGSVRLSRVADSIWSKLRGRSSSDVYDVKRSDIEGQAGSDSDGTSGSAYPPSESQRLTEAIRNLHVDQVSGMDDLGGIQSLAPRDSDGNLQNLRLWGYNDWSRPEHVKAMLSNFRSKHGLSESDPQYQSIERLSSLQTVCGTLNAQDKELLVEMKTRMERLEPDVTKAYAEIEQAIFGSSDNTFTWNALKNEYPVGS